MINFSFSNKNPEHFKDIFNNMTGRYQWKWASKNKDNITIDLFKDVTSFTFNYDVDDNKAIFIFKHCLGNELGALSLLDAEDFKNYNY